MGIPQPGSAIPPRKGLQLCRTTVASDDTNDNSRGIGCKDLAMGSLQGGFGPFGAGALRRFGGSRLLVILFGSGTKGYGHGEP